MFNFFVRFLFPNYIYSEKKISNFYNCTIREHCSIQANNGVLHRVLTCKEQRGGIKPQLCLEKLGNENL